MSTVEEQIAQLEAAIAGQELLRPTLGDAVVDATLALLRERLATLRDRPEHAPLAWPAARTAAAGPLGYLPRELAAKIRAVGRIEGERKQVSVLFADLVGFTALGERLDPEELAALTGAVLRELAAVVYEHEGYVDKFVGDSVMALFGAPIAHEDDPERALRTALAMRERLAVLSDRWAGRLGAPLQLHAGVHTGSVIAGPIAADLLMSYTAIGDTVNTAARIADAAAPGQILVSRATHRLTRAAFTFVAREPIVARGKPEPLAVYEPRQARRTPGKARGLGDVFDSPGAFVGRERELAALRAVAAELFAGRGRVVMLTGEAGLGKSRLLAEWRGELADRVTWAEGTSFAHTTGLAYGPFVDLLRRHAGIRDDDSEATARSRLAAVVATAFPDAPDAFAVLAGLLVMRLEPAETSILTTLPAEALRGRIFGLVEMLVERMAGQRPTVLVFEDLHWADMPSLELIEGLLPLVERLPLAVVGVFRLDPDRPFDDAHSRVAATYREQLTRVSIAPLSAGASIEMVEHLLATATLPEPLAAIIRTKGEGNPLFVEEVIRALIDHGALVKGDGGWRVTPSLGTVTVPQTLQGLLMARLDRLPDDARRVAQHAAVIGRVFQRRVLERVLPRSTSDVPDLDGQLRLLEREAIIRELSRQPELEYTFRHALVQEAAYESLLGTRRREIHHRVGVALEDVFAERLSEFQSIIGEHFFRGEAWEKAWDYLIRSGDAAARLYATAGARLHYARAIEALAHLPTSAENRRRLVDARIRQASVTYTIEDPEQILARLAAAETLARPLAEVSDASDADRLRLARVHYWIGRIMFYRNQLPESLAYFRQVLQVARELGDEDLLTIPSSALGRALALQGQFGEAQPLIERAVTPLERLGQWNDWVFTVSFLGAVRAARGDVAAGLAECERALIRAHRDNNPVGVAVAGIVRGFVYLQAADAARALASCDAALAVAEETRDDLYRYLGNGFRAWALGRLDRPTEALAGMARARDFGARLGGRLALSAWFTAAEAELLLTDGQLDAARARSEQALADATLANDAFAAGLAHRQLARALAALDPSRAAEIDGHLGESLRLFEAGDARLEQARTRLTWAAICRARGDVQSARGHLARAAEQFRRSGLRDELERTREMMAAVIDGEQCI